ncbi:hypothetical protein FG379_002162 [Cryptosporidium bovis]|uniref:uncharacterized protein n=1 Tax=Cryptosporidium bovis TaxID=310047 RepID=UPI003519E974|nr:hypothetical protein FG379_002162 [Cryptosporidium bovis]
MIFDEINSNRNNDKLELNSRKNVQLDDELLFWMNIEDEYFSKVDSKLKEILKFHINSSEYILKAINEILNNEKNILTDNFSYHDSSYLIFNGGLDEWNKVNCNLNGDGYGLYDNNDTLYINNDHGSSINYNNDIKIDDKIKYDNNNNSRKIKNIRLTLSIPPLYKPSDFPKELNHCNNVRDILLTLFRLHCLNKYTPSNSNKNLRNVNDKVNELLYRENTEFDKNKSFNYICILPDIITGPNITFCCSDDTKDENVYNFNDISDNWIFNINNSKLNLYLRKRLLDTSNIQFSDIKDDFITNHTKDYCDEDNIYQNNDLNKKKNLDCDNVTIFSSNIVKTIIGSEEYIKNDKGFIIDENKLISVIDDTNLESDSGNVDSNNKIICDNKGGERIKKLKSFGDFFQDNINISPNMDNMLLDNKNELNKSVYTNNNLNSIMNSNNKINFVSSSSNYFNYDDYNMIKPNETRNIYYLNRINNISLEDISKSLIKRLEEISMKKIKLFKVILDRIENERQIDIDYWLKKEYELNSYYRVKQCELNNYNYTLEKQSKDLEIYRLGCIESKYLPNEWQETAVCSICGNDTDWDEDPIYFCDGCYQPAHHSCVNPKQPFKYNSTRMLNVIEREKKCQQGDFNSENLNLKNKTEQDDDDQWWLCDSCLTIKSELLDHRYLFFLLIRMISGPRNSESYKQSREYIQKNVDLFLSQLVNYNVLSINVVTNNNKNIENNDKIVFPWINSWKFPLISENNSFCENDDGEYNTNASNLTSERRKGRPRKTPSITPSKPKNNFHYFTFEFDNYCNKKDEYSAESNLYLFNDWIPSIEIPYNLADLDLFNKQIFNPIKWYTELNNKKKMNQTPPPIYIMTDNDNFQDKIDINDDKLIRNNNNNNNNLFDVYKNDGVIIEKLIEKRIIEYDSIDNKYKIHVKVPICQLCGYDSYSRGGGIMKKTVDGYWSHIRCALSNNSVLSNDGNYVRIKIDLHRNKIKCEGCNKIDSSPVLCHNNECSKYYHINCASSIKECIVDWESNKPIFYCPEHASYIAPTLLLRKYQLSNFNKWFYDKYYNNSLKYRHSVVKMDISNFNDASVTNNYKYKYNEGDKLSIFSNVFNLPIIIRQTFLADLRDDTQTVIFLTKLLKVLYNNNNNNNNTLDSSNINPNTNIEINNKCKSDINESLFNSFSKFHLYLPELVYVQSIDTVISRLTTPWSGDVNFWLKTLNNNILNTLGINNIYNINQYKYIDNSRLIITCTFNIMELLLNRLINPYEIRLITLIIASKMGFGPWFSLFYYWKFIPLTFYYNIIKNSDLSMLEPTSSYSINNSMQNHDHNINSCNILSALDHKNVNYHLHLFGLKYLSIEKLNPSEACLKSINSCYSIISKNWNYCCQICNSVYPIFNENIQFSNVSNCHLYKCQICNVVICFHCNNFYNIISIQNHNNGFTCERCFYFRSKDYFNVVTDSCCCLCSRFDNILIRIQKGTYIDFRNIKSRKTLLSDGSIYLDEQYKLIDDVWVHPLCIEWLTSYSKNQSSLIYNIISLEKKYFNNLCKYCGLNSGIAIKCSHNSCNTYFHVSCGKSIGCKFDYSKYKNKQYDQFGNTNIYSGSYNNNNNNYCYQQQYRRSWCLFHNQYNNNSIIHNNNSNDNNNSNQHDLNNNYHNNKNYIGITSSGSQDVVLLRTLFNSIIENHKKINNNNLDNSCYYSTSQNDNTLLKISLLNYYGLSIFEDYNKNNKNSNLNNIGVYNSLLFSNDFQLKNNNINYQCGHDILYISKWDDLIQILCYDVITRFIYGVGLPKQKHINSSVNRNLNQNKKKLSCNNNQKQNVNEITKNNDISNNMCIACDKLYKRDWSLLYLDWIYCDTCNNWFHWCCLGLNKGNIPKDNEPYKCIFCSGFKKTRGRKRKTLINPLELNVANVSSYNNQHKISHSNSNTNLYIDESKNMLFPHSISQNQMIESNLSSITNESDLNNNIISNINYNSYKYTEGPHTQPQLVTNIGINDNKEMEFYTNNRSGDMLTSENRVSVCDSIKYSSQSQPSLPSPSSSSSSYSSSFSSPSRSSFASESS